MTGPVRRTPLKQRTTPLRSTKPLKPDASTGGKLRGAGTPPIAAERRSRRETGFTAAQKLDIRARAGNGDPDQARCEATGVFLGRYGGEVQHRAARGMGGGRPRNHLANGALLSREAHRLAETRDEHLHAQGFWLRSDEDPRQVPIMLHGTDGGLVAWLSDDGHYCNADGHILGGRP